MSWEIYKGESKVGTIDGSGNVYIAEAKAGFVTKQGDVYDRTMTKRGVVKADGDVVNRGTTLIGSVSPSGDIYRETTCSGRVTVEGADGASQITVFQAGGAALLLW
jgi:hypothetical protein